WVQFYQKPYIIASLNPNISNISNDDWYAAPNSTNCAEAAHSMSNREGKQLKLMTAILRGQKLDMRYFKRIEIKKNYNIDLSGHDKSGIKRKISAIKRSSKLTESNSNKNDSSNINNEMVMTPIEKLEYEECMLLIEERKEKLRELRIANTIKEREYGLEQE
ncbi:10961_t:CDS:2, partial [Dentiscutata heterogama]